MSGVKDIFLSVIGDNILKGEHVPPRKRPTGDPELGKAIRTARKKAKVTQQELAQILGFSKRDIIIGVERGKIGLFEDELKKIHSYLQVLDNTQLILREPASRPSIADLQARYHAEKKQWVAADHGVPYVAVFPLMDAPLQLLTRQQVKRGRLHQLQYHIPTHKLSHDLCEQIIASYKNLAPNAMIYDGTKKARLVTARYDADTSTLRLAYALGTYYDNLITHRLLDYLLLSTEEKQLAAQTTLRDIFEPDTGDGHLPALGLKSALANTLGRGGLVITQDDHLILVRRSDRVVADANLYDLSVQGSADIHDITAHTYDVFADFKQEAKDELCIATSAWVRLPGRAEALWLMALVRNAAQGGKPDILFLGKTSETIDVIKINAAKAEHHWENRFATSVPPETTMDELRVRLNPSNNHSPACRAALALLIRWAEEHHLVTIRDISEKLGS